MINLHLPQEKLLPIGNPEYGSIQTRSMTTSLPHSARHSAATLQTCITASGSSALTWNMGAPTTLATSVQYGDEREERGSVVKPIYEPQLQENDIV